MDVSTLVSQYAALGWMGMGENAQETMLCYALTIVRKHVAMLTAPTFLPYATWVKYAVKTHLPTTSLGAAHLGVSVAKVLVA